VRAASVAAGLGAVAGLVLLVGFRAGAWLMNAAVAAWFRWQAEDDDGHDVWATDMESAK